MSYKIYLIHGSLLHISWVKQQFVNRSNTFIWFYKNNKVPEKAKIICLIKSRKPNPFSGKVLFMEHNNIFYVKPFIFYKRLRLNFRKKDVLIHPSELILIPFSLSRADIGTHVNCNSRSYSLLLLGWLET